MLNKRTYIVGGVVLGVAALVAIVILMSRGTSPQVAPTTGTTSTITSGTASGTTPSALSTNEAQATTAGTAPSTTGTNGTGGSATVSGLKVFQKLPDPGIPAVEAKSPAAPGQTLAPLTAAPEPTVAAIKTGLTPDGAAYAITMRPYGIGPDSMFGSRLVIRVDSAKPMGSAPALPLLLNANVLALADTANGGGVTKGGTYTAILTFRSDGTKLLPVLSQAKLSK